MIALSPPIFLVLWLLQPARWHLGEIEDKYSLVMVFPVLPVIIITFLKRLRLYRLHETICGSYWGLYTNGPLPALVNDTYTQAEISDIIFKISILEMAPACGTT